MSQTGESINWEKVEQFLRLNIDGLNNEKMKVQQFPEGFSNLTYLVSIGEWEAVLRRPPFGPIPPKAHDMEREYRILEKVNPVFPLAPKPHLFCSDPLIMEKHFYVMEKKSGVVIDDRIPPEYEATEQTARIISETIVNTLVQLHAIDIEQAGLSGIGHPEDYLKRQVPGWIKRYHNVQTEVIQEVGAIENWLLQNIPASVEPTIVHNDFKLNNIMLSRTDPGTAIGIFDWEMCTVGDPLTDLAFALVCWTKAGDYDLGFPTVTSKPGFFSRGEFLEKYTTGSGRDVDPIDYHMAFAYYKLGVIMQQMYYRWKQGQARDQRFSSLGEVVNNLMTMAGRAENKQLVW